MGLPMHFVQQVAQRPKGHHPGQHRLAGMAGPSDQATKAPRHQATESPSVQVAGTDIEQTDIEQTAVHSAGNATGARPGDQQPNNSAQRVAQILAAYARKAHVPRA